MEWQPIETAPRGGEVVLLWDDGYTVGYWREATGGFQDCATSGSGDEEPIYPTLWATLPERPEPIVITGGQFSGVGSYGFWPAEERHLTINGGTAWYAPGYDPDHPLPSP